jgi:hypothetical protein
VGDGLGNRLPGAAAARREHGDGQQDDTERLHRAFHPSAIRLTAT